MVNRQLLAGVELFAKLTDDQLDSIASGAQVHDLHRGDVVFHEGDQPNDMYVVMRGRIAVGNRSYDGRESLVALMETGDPFGELGMFDGRGRSAEARAIEPSTIIRLPYEQLRKVYSEEPSLLWQVAELLANRLRNMDEVLADAVFLDVIGRTAKRLLEMSAGANEFYLPVTQEELSGMVGASRERVNKAIAAFIKLGWIEQSGREYRFLKRSEIENRSR